MKEDTLTKEFKLKLKQFIEGCDALEESGAWDKEEYGEMEAFYQNDLVVAILSVISADGVISEQEAESLNMAFGFEYTADELREVYENCGDTFEDFFEEQAKDDFELLKAADADLAETYRELLDLICDIVIHSDGISSQNETEELERIKASIFSL